MNGFDQVSRHILKLSLLSLICLHYLPTMKSKTFMNSQSHFHFSICFYIKSKQQLTKRPIIYNNLPSACNPSQSSKIGLNARLSSSVSPNPLTYQMNGPVQTAKNIWCRAVSFLTKALSFQSVELCMRIDSKVAWYGAPLNRKILFY